MRRIDEALWQLGTWESPSAVYECFYRRPAPPSEAGAARLSAYRQALVQRVAERLNLLRSDTPRANVPSA
jgi:hypothetical protein